MSQLALCLTDSVTGHAKPWAPTARHPGFAQQSRRRLPRCGQATKAITLYRQNLPEGLHPRPWASTIQPSRLRNNLASLSGPAAGSKGHRLYEQIVAGPVAASWAPMTCSTSPRVTIPPPPTGRAGRLGGHHLKDDPRRRHAFDSPGASTRTSQHLFTYRDAGQTRQTVDDAPTDPRRCHPPRVPTTHTFTARNRLAVAYQDAERSWTGHPSSVEPHRRHRLAGPTTPRALSSRGYPCQPAGMPDRLDRPSCSAEPRRRRPHPEQATWNLGFRHSLVGAFTGEAGRLRVSPVQRTSPTSSAFWVRPLAPSPRVAPRRRLPGSRQARLSHPVRAKTLKLNLPVLGPTTHPASRNNLCNAYRAAEEIEEQRALQDAVRTLLSPR